MGERSIGNFLMAGDRPVGILLTIPKIDRQTGRKVVNLSSWYVKESHRWSAAHLMIAALAERDTVYTDLTPTKAAVEMNMRFGFRTIGFKLILLFLPWLALVGRKQDRLVPFEAVQESIIPGDLMVDLKRHQNLGCIVTTVKLLDRHSPVVFNVVSRKGIRVAQVVYAEDRDIIINNLAAFARLLVLRGVLLLMLQVAESENVPGAFVWGRNRCYQVKGEWNDDLIDELYSERVLLRA